MVSSLDWYSCSMLGPHDENIWASIAIAQAAEYRCLVRASDGKKKITTEVLSLFFCVKLSKFYSTVAVHNSKHGTITKCCR